MIKSGPVKVAAIYVLMSIAWILLSDKLLFLLGGHLPANTFFIINSSKGIGFAIVTGIVLYYLIRHNNKQLLETEYEYHDLFKTNPNPMWIYDPRSLKFLSVNEAAIQFYGYSRDEFLKMTIKDIRPGEDHEKLIAAVNNINNYRQSGTWRHIKKNGEMIYAIISSHTIKYQNRDAIIVLVRDCTDNIYHEQQLQLVNANLTEEKKRLSDVQELTKIAGWEYDIAQNSLNISDELLRLLGIEREQLKVDESFFLRSSITITKMK